MLFYFIQFHFISSYSISFSSLLPSKQFNLPFVGILSSTGRKIIENILFGAASARKVFWPYSSGTQWSRCYKVVLAILPWNKVESRLEYSCHTALEHWVPAEYSQNTVLAENGNSHGFHQLIEILNVVYLKC